MERKFLKRIDVGPLVKGEPAGCVLLYAIEDGISLVITSRENGDAELFFNRKEAKKIISAINLAIQ